MRNRIFTTAAAACTAIVFTVKDPILAADNRTCPLLSSVNAEISGTITLEEDLVIDETLILLNDSKIDLNGHSIILNGNGPVLETAENADTTELDGDGMITHGEGYSGPGIRISDYSRLKMNNGTVSGNDGYGIELEGDLAYLELYGGTISNNTDGGILVGENSVFEYNNGTVTENPNTGIVNHGTLRMNGGMINNNRAEYAAGIYSDGSLEIYGGTIENNMAETYAGGIFCKGEAILGNAHIDNNAAWEYGDGVVFEGGAEDVLILRDSTFIRNNANDNLYLKNGGLISFSEDGELQDPEVGITLETGTGQFTDGITETTLLGDPLEFFFSDRDEYFVSWNTSMSELLLMDSDPPGGDGDKREEEESSDSRYITPENCQGIGYPAGYAYNAAAFACEMGYLDEEGVFHPVRDQTGRSASSMIGVPDTADDGK